MKLQPQPFNLIAKGVKTIESRLYDEKRQKVDLGDTIVFSQSDDETQKVEVKVIGLLRYASFEDMFAHNDPKKFGGTNAADLVRALEKHYSLQEQASHSVIGIEIKKL